ncbi:MAG: isochorismatase family protein [Alphaproteobacteria bacterium]|nr:isochorismatase family protein [Alphaproteobacteria bacterium]MBV9693152.1 isochorismatase family protein [Alphaproteobacteria bacterium]
MSEIVQFDKYRHVRAAPPLVFVDMVRHEIDPEPGFGEAESGPVLARCRQLLREARSRHWPIAFVRSAMRSVPGFASAGARWIDGFEPRRCDMVFERHGASCYSSDEFARAMDAAGRVYIVAGFSADNSCLATLMDAPLNNHFVGVVQDAAATRPLPGLDAAESHRAVIAVSSRYATILSTEHWIDVAVGATIGAARA